MEKGKFMAMTDQKLKKRRTRVADWRIKPLGKGQCFIPTSFSCGFDSCPTLIRDIIALLKLQHHFEPAGSCWIKL